MINFVQKVDSVQRPFPKTIRCHNDHAYFFCNDLIQRYSYQNQLLRLNLSFEQSMAFDFHKVLFLNQCLFSDKSELIVVNSSKIKDCLLVSLYNSMGVCERKQVVRKRHCFTECQAVGENHLIIHDHQNYLEIYKLSLSGGSILEKVYKLSVRLDVPFIFIGLAVSESHLFLMTAQKDKLLIYQKDFGQMTKETKIVEDESIAVHEQINPTGEISFSEKKKSLKKIDNLSAFELTIELDLPSSFPFNLVYNSGALFFATNDAVFRVIVGSKLPDQFNIPSVVRLQPNDQNSISCLSMRDITQLPLQGKVLKSFPDVIKAWDAWGLQEKTELIDFQKLAPDVYLILTPQDCFLLDHGQFIQGMEFFPVLINSFRLS